MFRASGDVPKGINSPGSISRRRLLRNGSFLSSLAVAGALLAACQQSAATPTAPATSATAPAQAPAAAAAAPTTAKPAPSAAAAKPTTAAASAAAPTTTGGGTMVGAFDVGPGGCPQCWDPRKRSAGATWYAKMWSPLINNDPSMTKLVAELAEKWEPNKDGSVWTVHLRNGLKWSDGQPLTTKDVYFQYKVLLSKEMLGAAGTALKDIAGAQDYFDGKAKEISGIKVIDDTTVEFHLTSPSGLFPQSLVAPLEFAEHFFSKFSMQEIAGGQMLRQPRPCSGPFQWSKYVQDQYIEATANPNYWRGRPKLDKLINRYFDAEATAILALQRGEIQFTYISGNAVPTFQNDANTTLIQGPSFVTNFIIFNFREPTLQDLKVRQAFMYAIDRDKIIQTLFKGAAQKVESLFWEPDYMPGDLTTYTYDPEKAKSLLKEANWKPNPKWDLITYYSDQLSGNVMQAMQQYLSVVGINVVPRTMDVPSFNNLFNPAKDWQVGYIGQGNRSALDLQARWYEGGDPTATGTCKSPHGCFPGLPETTKLIDTYRGSLTADDQNNAMKQIVTIMNKQLPDAYMWTSQRYGVVSKKVKDFVWTPAPGGGPYYDKAELWQIG